MTSKNKIKLDKYKIYGLEEKRRVLRKAKPVESKKEILVSPQKRNSLNLLVFLNGNSTLNPETTNQIELNLKTSEYFYNKLNIQNVAEIESEKKAGEKTGLHNPNEVLLYPDLLNCLHFWIEDYSKKINEGGENNLYSEQILAEKINDFIEYNNRLTTMNRTEYLSGLRFDPSLQSSKKTLLDSETLSSSNQEDLVSNLLSALFLFKNSEFNKACLGYDSKLKLISTLDSHVNLNFITKITDQNIKLSTQVFWKHLITRELFNQWQVVDTINTGLPLEDFAQKMKSFLNKRMESPEDYLLYLKYSYARDNDIIVFPLSFNSAASVYQKY